MIEYYYRTEDYEKLFDYFFEVYIWAFSKGFASVEFGLYTNRFPDLEIDSGGIVVEYLGKSLSLLREAYSPQMLSLFLDHLYVEAMHRNISTEQIHMLDLSSRLVQALHTSDLEVLLDTSRIWTKKTKQTAETFFFPRLPQAVRDKFHITNFPNTVNYTTPLPKGFDGTYWNGSEQVFTVEPLDRPFDPQEGTFYYSDEKALLYLKGAFEKRAEDTFFLSCASESGREVIPNQVIVCKSPELVLSIRGSDVAFTKTAQTPRLVAERGRYV